MGFGHTTGIVKSELKTFINRQSAAFAFLNQDGIPADFLFQTLGAISKNIKVIVA